MYNKTPSKPTPKPRPRAVKESKMIQREKYKAAKLVRELKNRQSNEEQPARYLKNSWDLVASHKA